jgi:hypothetical protein
VSYLVIIHCFSLARWFAGGSFLFGRSYAELSAATYLAVLPTSKMAIGKVLLSTASIFLLTAKSLKNKYKGVNFMRVKLTVSFRNDEVSAAEEVLSKISSMTHTNPIAIVNNRVELDKEVQFESKGLDAYVAVIINLLEWIEDTCKRAMLMTDLMCLVDKHSKAIEPAKRDAAA